MWALFVFGIQEDWANIPFKMAADQRPESIFTFKLGKISIILEGGDKRACQNKVSPTLPPKLGHFPGCLAFSETTF